MVLWGVGMGAQESIIRAVVADIVPRNRRATGYGIFNTGFGIAWFAGSASWDSSTTDLYSLWPSFPRRPSWGPCPSSWRLESAFVPLRLDEDSSVRLGSSEENNGKSLLSDPGLA